MEAAQVSLCAHRHGNRHSGGIAKLILIDQRAVSKGLAFGRLKSRWRRDESLTYGSWGTGGQQWPPVTRLQKKA